MGSLKRVLICDDSFVMRNNLRRVFEESGMEVVGEAANGTDVLQEYQWQKPDLVTMDINMPVMDGITALRKLIERYPDAKVIMVSAKGQKHQLFEAIKAGAKHFLVKPITKERTMEVVNAVLELDQ